MNEKYLPEIKLDYQLNGSDQDSTTLFVLAGKKYAQDRPVEEDNEQRIQFKDSFTFITYGRKVLNAVFSEEVRQQADEMQAEIEERIAQLGNADIAKASFKGRWFPYDLPE